MDKEKEKKVRESLNDIQRYFDATRNIPNNKGYSFTTKNLLMTNSNEQLSPVAFSDVGDTFNGYDLLIDHEELFRFFKDYKREVTDIEMKDGKIKILTSIPNIEITLDLPEEYKDEFKESKRLTKNMLDEVNELEEEKYPFSNEAIALFRTANDGILYLDGEDKTTEFYKPDHSNYVEVRLFTKYIGRYLASTKEQEFRLYRRDDGTGILRYSGVNPGNAKTYQYFNIIL